MDIIPAETIDPKNNDSVAQVREKLLQLSESGSDAAYAAQTLNFMRACGVPAIALNEDGKSAEAGTSVVKSMINGVPTYAIRDTTQEDYAAIHDRAKDAFHAWNNLPVEARQEFFRIMAEEVGPKYEKAIDLAITLDVGKAGSEYAKLAEWDKWAASETVKNHLLDYHVSDDHGNRHISPHTKHIHTHIGPKSGRGITGGTNGFNYPGALAMPDIASSRVAGNALIEKAPSKAPAFLFIRKKMEDEAIDLLAQRFNSYDWAGKAKESGLDLNDAENVQRLKNGFSIISGRHVIEQWAKDSDTFRLVGGGAAGKEFRKHRTDKYGLLRDNTILELAGNNPLVVMPSAAELPAAKEGAPAGLARVVAENAEGNKSNSGQRCTSPRRWFVHADIYDKVEALARAEYEKSAANGDGAIGNPLDPKTKVGAIDKGGFEDAQEYLKRAREAGAEVIGGNRILSNNFPNARYMTPALVIWDKAPAGAEDMMHEKEIFAPIANLARVADLDEAIAKTNKSTENLSGAIYTQNPEELKQFYDKTRLGSLLHNTPPKDSSPAAQHAGIDDGGIGSTGGLHSLEQYHRQVRTRKMLKPGDPSFLGHVTQRG